MEIIIKKPRKCKTTRAQRRNIIKVCKTKSIWFSGMYYYIFDFKIYNIWIESVHIDNDYTKMIINIYK